MRPSTRSRPARASSNAPGACSTATASRQSRSTSAGLTRGGFYHHFANKEELYSEAIASYARCDPASSLNFAASARQIVLQMVNAYLSRQHLEDIDRHCPMIALPSDVARAGPAVRRTYEMLLDSVLAAYDHRCAISKWMCPSLNHPQDVVVGVT